MLLLTGAILLAIFVLPFPWGFLAVVGAALVEIAEAILFIRLSRRRRIQAGAETLIGAPGVVTAACRPVGQVRVQGELWQARCEAGADVGEAVRVLAREGLLLVVEREPGSTRK